MEPGKKQEWPVRCLWYWSVGSVNEDVRSSFKVPCIFTGDRLCGPGFETPCNRKRTRMADPMLKEALVRFDEFLDRVAQADFEEPTAMTLATTDSAGHVTARIVLLRGHDERGFVFYTNSESRKGHQLCENARAALCFYWDGLGEQVRVEGTVEAVSREESDTYWAGRPRDTRIGGWASQQSRPLVSWEELAERIAKYEQQFSERDVPRPEHWFGFRVVPDRIEFWLRGAARLHQRTVYARGEQGWTQQLLYP